MSSIVAIVHVYRSENTLQYRDVLSLINSNDYKIDFYPIIFVNTMGFEIEIIKFNANHIYKINFKEVLEKIKINVLQKNSLFLYLSCYNFQTEIKWIENEIITPLLLEDLSSLNKLPLNQILFNHLDTD